MEDVSEVIEGSVPEVTNASFKKQSVLDMKQIIEIIHPNEAIRTYAVTKILPRKDEGGYSDYNVRKVEQAHPDLAELVTELLAKPYVKDLGISKTAIRIEATDAFEDLWNHFNDEITGLLNFYLFDGQAEIRVRDDRSKYEAESRASHYDDVL
ncbi:hypothetical protein D3C87_278430 [compost metagenome]